MTTVRGCIIDAFLSPDRSRILAAGRLVDGRSFAFSLPARGREVFLPENVDFSKILVAAPITDGKETGSPVFVIDPDPWQSMEGMSCRRFFLHSAKDSRFGGRQASSPNFILSPSRPAWDFLSELDIGVRVVISGESRDGNAVDLYFPDPILSPDRESDSTKLRWLALDIETDPDSHVVAVSLARNDSSVPGSGEVLFFGPDTRVRGVKSFGSEAELLRVLACRIRSIDPDIITGWNVIDFDFRVLSARFSALGIPFAAARTTVPAGVSGDSAHGNARGAFVSIQGRVVLDAMRLVRGLGIRFEDQSLDTVSRRILGTGKTVTERGEDKLVRLEVLRRDDPAAYCAYCLADSTLVLDILVKTGLDALTLKRSILTGTGPDIAWTSIPVFERVYGAELRRRHIIPVARTERDVSGAAGGTILEPVAGLFGTVFVFDFRSLYPSIMRTFNVDPLARARAIAHPHKSDIVAPNAARFSREEGIIPSLIRSYASEREKALASGDETAAYVLKILQNSFYGVLGSSGCAYARTDLAGAITSFARKFLHLSRDWFEAGGRRVLYGDTDSVFVKANTEDGFGFEALEATGNCLATSLDRYLAQSIRTEYGLESFLKIRCEKVYDRFLIPRLRIDEDAAEGRGRSKGYAGLELDKNGSRVEIKGMEAVRSDWTTLARRFQTELVTLIFNDGDQRAVRDLCRITEAEVRSGRLDAELVYRKNLKRPVSSYASQSPQIKAARLMGWTNRRGVIAFVMTRRGAQPVDSIQSLVDYDHYVEKQLVPIARSVAAACGWKTDGWFSGSGQLDLDLF